MYTIRRVNTSVAVFVVIGIALAVGAATPPADAGNSYEVDQPPPPKLLQSYDLSWWSVDGGGGSSSGGAFAVTGSLGQPDAGSARACGAALAGGIWSGPELVEQPLFCDGFESGGAGAWSSVAP